MTSITVEIPEDLASQWNRLSKTEQERLLRFRLFKDLQDLPETSPSRDTQLLSLIGEGLPTNFWQRLSVLQQKAETSSLTQEEYKERLDLLTQKDQWHLKRMEYVLELAHLRHLKPRDLLKKLDIDPLQ
jgi:hypothetical protein